MTDVIDGDLAARIQHTLFAPGLDLDRLLAHCRECLDHGFDAAMIPACWVRDALAALAGSTVKVASAVDFPYGAMTTAGRIAEVRSLVEIGVHEIDLGIAIGSLRSGRFEAFRDDLRSTIAAAGRVPVKVMLELPLLDAGQRARAVEVAIEAGAAYLKNASSGAVGVASVDDIAYLRAAAPDSVGVKASGGIATRAHLQALIDAGADLAGTSNGVAIVSGDGSGSPDAY